VVQVTVTSQTTDRPTCLPWDESHAVGVFTVRAARTWRLLGD